MTRYLITGGAGFIASHLAEAMLARGDEIIALDNLSTGRIENIESIADHPGFEFVHGSILDEAVVDELAHRADVIVHLAAAVGVRLIIDEPLRSFITNLHGSQIVIEAALRYRRKILIASTSEVYGKNSDVPLAETSDSLLGPPTVARWSYAAAKYVDEILAYEYHRERGLDPLVVRFFNTVGPRQSANYGMVIPRLVDQALAGLPLTVHGDGTQSRCFGHVLDVVAAVLALLGDDRAVGEAFNVGSSEEVSILEVAERVVERAKSTSTVRLVPYAEAFPVGFEDIGRRTPDTTKVRDLTGWRPLRTLDDIIDDVIADRSGGALAGAGPTPT